MPTVLVTVGSTLFDDLTHAFAPRGEVIKALQEAKFDKLLLQYGKGSLSSKDFNTGDLQVDVFRYSDEIDALIEQSDLVISHAGE
jgi:UDP-N-acetylglucosamine transferase subunit ALG13